VGLVFVGLIISRKIEEGGGPQQAAILVNRLMTANTAEVPGIVEKLQDYRRWADPLLRKQFAKAGKNTSEKLRLALALLPIDETQIDYLRESFVRIDPSQSADDIQALEPILSNHKDRVIEPLWKDALDNTREPQERFRALRALASYASADPRWNQVNTFVANELVRVEARWLPWWRRGFRPVSEQLIKPLVLVARAKGNDAELDAVKRQQAAGLLFEYAADRPEDVYEFLVTGTSQDFARSNIRRGAQGAGVNLIDVLAAHKQQAIELAHQDLLKHPSEKATQAEKDSFARRQAKAAVVLLRLGEWDQPLSMLDLKADPRVRGILIATMGSEGVGASEVIQRLESESNLAIRRALVMALPGCAAPVTGRKALAEQRNPAIEKFLSQFASDPDPGVHAAINFLMINWGVTEQLQAAAKKILENDQQLRNRPSTDRRMWCENSQNQTILIFDARSGPTDAAVSSQKSERSGDQEPAAPGRRFAFAASEITFGEYRKFQREVGAADLEANSEYRQNQSWYDSQSIATSWYEAARYCNWLSEKDGIPREQWCYEPNDHGAYDVGMRAKKNHLALVGYRLPTEVECEYAFRGKDWTNVREQRPGFGNTFYVTNLYYGPTDQGVFIGNGSTWCFDRFATDGPAKKTPSEADSELLRDGDRRVVLVRGVGSSDRKPFAPHERKGYLRPARTLP
jgi:hypothetical protein